jgi:hypothetical protein
MLRVPDEFQDVPLGDADVLHEVPEGIGGAGWLVVDEFRRETGNRFLEAHMGVAAVEKGQEFFPQNLVLGHDPPPAGALLKKVYYPMGITQSDHEVRGTAGKRISIIDFAAPTGVFLPSTLK